MEVAAGPCVTSITIQLTVTSSALNRVMSLRSIWWGILVLSLVSLALSGRAFMTYHRNSMPVPTALINGLVGSVGGLLLVISQLLERGSALQWATLTSSGILLVISLVRSRRARSGAS
jgi:hypothetical protein